MNILRKRVISALLTVCLILSFVIGATNVWAEDSSGKTINALDAMPVDKKAEQKLKLETVPEVIGTETANERKHIERLYDKEGDSLYNAVFENIDGTETLYMFDYPIKYVSDTGEVKDIKLDIEEDKTKPGTFVSKEHSIQTTFSKKLSDGISLKDAEVSITLQPILSPLYSLVNTNTLTANLVDNKMVEYHLDEKTSLEYSLTYTGFKEDIVVNEYTGQTEYEFTLFTEGLTLEQIDSSYYLTDENGNIKATIGDIIIFTADERNNTFGSMSYETIRENQEYKLTIHVDADYLRDENTAYPIRIDPTIEINYDDNGSGAIQDVTINSEAGSSGSSGSLFVGKREKYGISRTLMRFPSLNLLTFKSANHIISATVEIRDIMCEAESLTVYCYVFTGNAWIDTAANWSNVSPNSYATFLSSNVVSYSNGVDKTPKHRYSFDITAAVKGWKEGTYLKDRGIIFKDSSSVENGSTTISKTFASYNRSSNKPSLLVNYEVPQYTINHYIDEGYKVRFGGISNVSVYHDVVADKFYSLFGVELNLNTTSHVSSADSCKKTQFGSVTTSNLTASCVHSTNHLTTSALRKLMGNGTCLSSRVLWTGHILPGNPSSNSVFSSYSVVITPRHTTDSTNSYINLSDSKVRTESIYTLMHELSHQLGAPDHYCRKDYQSDGKCTNAYCDVCVYGMTTPRSCMMSYRYNIETTDESELYCFSCRDKINEHLALNH